MQTQTHRADTCTPAVLQAAVKKALTSAAFGQFMTGVVLNAVAEAGARPQGIVLPPMGRGRRFSERATYDGAARRCEFSDDAGNELAMIKYYGRPADTMSYGWSPAHWMVHQARVDARGNTWRACLGTHVMDDFGELVEVPQ